MRRNLQQANSTPGFESAPSLNSSSSSSINDASNGIIYSQLALAQQKILKRGQACYHPKWVGTKEDFIKDFWKNELGNVSALVYPFCADGSSLGNYLGIYLNEAVCALRSGAHFINNQISIGWDSVDNQGNYSSFYNSFPNIIVNADPKPSEEVKALLKKECECPRYCWQEGNSPMWKNVSFIREQVRNAVAAYLNTVNVSKGTTIVNTTDISSEPIGTFLPLIPDVAIQYRCGDNMDAKPTALGYGVLPFFAYPPLIPPHSKHIYIMTDPPKRAGAHPYVAHCAKIVQRLFHYIKERFPNSTVVVKKGGDLYLDVARLAYANVTVCSASTFCLFPAMANNGTVHFPVSRLVPHPDSPSDPRHFVSDNFHWLHEPKVVGGGSKPWDLIFFALEGRTITKADMEGQLVKGHGREVFYVKNQTRHSFPNMDTFEGLGFDWGRIWHIGDNDVNSFPVGEPMSLPPPKPVS